ncbi:hypothetical protein PVK06_009259 [Gossypium arboreum]|uniref:Uncharacterized protein n=1 Tax=Gossypium arboreum TaxID=29729 RepID=A0ABR0QN66_GOSAR|nr:hypothetical protein PVK06_009259 [Gossypium arboreum]
MGAYRTEGWDTERRGFDLQSGNQFEYHAFPQTLDKLELEFKREATELGRIRDKEEDEENYKHRELSMWRYSDELRVRADELHRSLRRDAKHYIEFWKQIPPSEPYRVILGDVRDKLYQTSERSRQLLSHGMSEIPGEANFTNIEQFLEPLELCYRSLCSCGDRPIADGSLLDFLRQVSTFGLSLVKLGIRQESDRHTDVLDAITKHLEIGSYQEWSEEQKQEWLLFEPSGKRSSQQFNFGAYIISTATAPSDVLAIELLQHLEAALAALARFFSVDWYRNRINGKQEVMIGYSDSAATLEHGMHPPVSPKPKWRALMDEMAIVATEEYRYCWW